jgi:UDP-N-acetylglucosamine--N-acetylmuramyl-(pentapeptide) pyrophosphoryl-undecaprenol N-acetylglucosamine transferase
LINRAVESVLPSLLESCRVVHQCGRQPAGEEQDYDCLVQAGEKLDLALRRRFFVTQFLGEEIRDVFALADLVVGRAGAGTVAELCALAKPAVYIPLVPTGGDEQTRNAQMCVREGAAKVLPQSELSGESLLEAVQSLLADSEKLKQMGQAARTLAKPQAAQVLAQTILEMALK